VPEDLSLAIARCLEKDPENRWPTADALRRSLESRTVTGYRPTRTGMRAASRQSTTGTRPRPSSTLERQRGSPSPREPLGPRSPRPLPAPRVGARGRGEYVRNERGEWIRVGDSDHLPVPDTGEPPIVQKARAQFARWAAVTGGCFLINIATGITNGPWFLFVAGGMGFPLLKTYSQLWQAGYSWRDVLNRPPAADAIQVPGAKGRKMIAAPKANEYGSYYDRIKKVHDDRGFILRMLQKLPEADRKELPEVAETTEALYLRATELARTLNDMDQSFERGTPERIRAQLDGLALKDQTEERNRQIAILERQLRTAGDLGTRREAFLQRFESSALAMQNLRLDLMKLKTQGLGALGDVTSATQQARAISRDVENLTAAASEVREALG
jgi:serine/threonine-protein kinase